MPQYWPRWQKPTKEVFASWLILILEVQGRSKISILIDNWHDIDGDLKNKLWTDIMVFIIYFMNCFTIIDDHYFFLFNTSIISTM